MSLLDDVDNGMPDAESAAAHSATTAEAEGCSMCSMSRLSSSHAAMWDSRMRSTTYVIEEQSIVQTQQQTHSSCVMTHDGGGMQQYVQSVQTQGGGISLSATPRSAFASPAGAGDPVRSNDPNGTLYLYGMGVCFESGDTLFVTNRRVLPTDVGYEYYRALAYDGIPRVEAVFVKDGDGAVVPARQSPLLKAHRDPSAFAALVEKEFDDIDSDVARRKNTWRGRELKRSGAHGVMTTSTMASLPSIVTQHDVSVTSVVRRAVVTRTQCASAEAAADTARRQMCSDNEDTSRCEDEEEEEKEEEEDGRRDTQWCGEEDTEQQQADAACRRAECLEKEDTEQCILRCDDTSRCEDEEDEEKEDTEEEEEEGKEEEEDVDTATHDVVADDAAVRRVESDHLAEEREGRRAPVRLGDEEDDWTKKKKEDVLRARGNTQCEYVQCTACADTARRQMCSDNEDTECDARQMCDDDDERKKKMDERVASITRCTKLPGSLRARCDGRNCESVVRAVPERTSIVILNNNFYYNNSHTAVCSSRHGNTQCEYVQTPRSNVGQQMQTHNGSLCDHHARSTTSSSTENEGSILLLILLMVILLTTISFQIVMIMD